MLLSRNPENQAGFCIAVVGVAQLVEPRIVIPVVVGSSPIVHPIPQVSCCREGDIFSRKAICC